MLNISFVVLSAERGALSPRQNLSRNHELRRELEAAGLRLLSAEGVWQGVREASFVVVIRNLSDGFIVSALATRFEQDAILYVDHARDATLFFAGGASQAVGTWGPYFPADDTRPIGQRGYTDIGGLPYAAI